MARDEMIDWSQYKTCLDLPSEGPVKADRLFITTEFFHDRGLVGAVEQHANPQGNNELADELGRLGLPCAFGTKGQPRSSKKKKKLKHGPSPDVKLKYADPHISQKTEVSKWRQAWDDTWGAHYYYNEELQVTQWEPPDEPFFPYEEDMPNWQDSPQNIASDDDSKLKPRMESTGLMPTIPDPCGTHLYFDSPSPGEKEQEAAERKEGMETSEGGYVGEGEDANEQECVSPAQQDFGGEKQKAGEKQQAAVEQEKNQGLYQSEREREPETNTQLEAYHAHHTHHTHHTHHVQQEPCHTQHTQQALHNTQQSAQSILSTYTQQSSHILDSQRSKHEAGSPDLSPDLSLGLSPDLSLGLSPDLSLGLSPDLSLGLSPDLSLGLSPGLSLGLSPDLSLSLSPNRRPHDKHGTQLEVTTISISTTCTNPTQPQSTLSHSSPLNATNPATSSETSEQQTTSQSARDDSAHTNSSYVYHLEFAARHITQHVSRNPVEHDVTVDTAQHACTNAVVHDAKHNATHHVCSSPVEHDAPKNTAQHVCSNPVEHDVSTCPERPKSGCSEVPREPVSSSAVAAKRVQMDPQLSSLVRQMLPRKNSKYYWQRYSFFSRFDEGVLLDPEGWFSVTPEVIAHHQASRCKPGTLVLDAFAGCGGNSVQFAKAGMQVVALDLCSDRLLLAQHNAFVYGVETRIDFICADFFCVGPSIPADVIFLSPPWGGPDYKYSDVYDLGCLLPGMKMTLAGLLRYCVDVVKSRNGQGVVCFLPRNCSLEQLNALVPDGTVWHVERCVLNGVCKGLTVYCGEF